MHTLQSVICTEKTYKHHEAKVSSCLHGRCYALLIPFFVFISSFPLYFCQCIPNKVDILISLVLVLVALAVEAVMLSFFTAHPFLNWCYRNYVQIFSSHSVLMIFLKIKAAMFILFPSTHRFADSCVRRGGSVVDPQILSHLLHAAAGQQGLRGGGQRVATQLEAWPRQRSTSCQQETEEKEGQTEARSEPRSDLQTVSAWNINFWS